MATDNHARNTKSYWKHLRNMVVICFTSHKGGVGKTSAAFHIACGFPFALADGFVRNRVLFIDLDESGGGTRNFLPDYTGKKDYLESEQIGTVYDFLTCSPDRESLLRCLNSIEGDGVSFLASSPYSAIEGLLQNDPELLRKRLALIDEDFDVCVIDSPPARGWLQRTALLSADEVMVCSDISANSLAGVQDALLDITDLNRLFKRDIGVPAILVKANAASYDKNPEMQIYSKERGAFWFKHKLKQITDVEPIVLPYDPNLLNHVNEERKYIYSFSRKGLAKEYARITVWLTEEFLEKKLQYPAFTPFETYYSNDNNAI